LHIRYIEANHLLKVIDNNIDGGHVFRRPAERFVDSFVHSKSDFMADLMT